MKTFIIGDDSTNIAQRIRLGLMNDSIPICSTEFEPIDEFTVTLTDKSLELIRNVKDIEYTVSSSKKEEKQPNYNRKNKWQSPYLFNK